MDASTVPPVSSLGALDADSVVPLGAEEISRWAVVRNAGNLDTVSGTEGVTLVA